MDDLKAILDRHRRLALPGFPDNDEFAEWVSELYEADVYYVGAATSLINGEKPLKLNRSRIDELDNGLEKFSALEDDLPVYQKCREYVDSLKLVVSLL
jgi:hypothetical protein